MDTDNQKPDRRRWIRAGKPVFCRRKSVWHGVSRIVANSCMWNPDRLWIEADHRLANCCIVLQCATLHLLNSAQPISVKVESSYASFLFNSTLFLNTTHVALFGILQSYKCVKITKGKMSEFWILIVKLIKHLLNQAIKRYKNPKTAGHKNLNSRI